MKKVFIVSAVRTPMGAFLGNLESLSAVELATVAVKGAIEQAGISPKDVETTVAGIVVKDGLKGNPARQVAYALGIPMEGCASTVEQQCATGLRALDIAAMEIQLGRYGIGVAFGAESMSNVPNLILNAKKGSVKFGGTKLGPLKVVDGLIHETLHDAMLDEHHCVAAGRCADQYKISRAAQDAYTFRSHQKTKESREAGLFKDEIVPVEIAGKKGAKITITEDEVRFPNVSLEVLESFGSVFPDSGSCTAVNSADLFDGASAMVLASEDKVKELGLKPLAEIVAIGVGGVHPSLTPVGPLKSIPKTLDIAGLKVSDIDTWEVNEAFALVPLVVVQELGVPMEKMNPLGGSLCIGHPFGESGMRILVTMLHHMKRNNLKLGCGSMCVGGGVSMAAILKNAAVN